MLIKKEVMASLFFFSPLALAESDLSLAYSACVIQSGSGSELSPHCIHEEIRRQNQRLGIVLQKTRESISPVQKRTLQKVQRAWMRYQKAHCAFYPHASGEQQMTTHTDLCTMQMTAARAQELEALLLN